jgi:RHS repeat-associated protein
VSQIWQTLAGVTGLAGSSTQTFVYDAANRLTESYFGPSDARQQPRAYSYDPDGNRTSVTESGVSFYYWYDRTDALLTKSPTTDQNGAGHFDFAYDALGNLTSSAPSGPGSSTLRPTTYTYDAPGHLLSITADGTKTAVTLDALGRRSLQTFATACGGTWCWDPNRNVAYEYLDTGNSVIGLDQVTADVVTYSYIDAIGNRLASETGGTTGFVLPDLHGNVVAVVAGGSSPTFLSAYRFDAYGETCADWHPASGAMDVPWRFQGRILESASGTTDLYDFGARAYDPSLGTFTSFDTVAGSAQNPLTLNRYLYALANPASMIDPSGHCVASNQEEADRCAKHPSNAVQDKSGRLNPVAFKMGMSVRPTEYWQWGGYHTSQSIELQPGKSKFESAVLIGQMRGKRLEDYLDANGAYALYVIANHDQKDQEWMYEEGIFRTAQLYLKRFDVPRDCGGPCLRDPEQKSALEAKWDEDRYFDMSDIDSHFIDKMPDESYGLNSNLLQLGAGLMYLARGVKSQNADEVVNGITSVFTVTDNRPAKARTPQDWNITVDYGLGKVSGGGMDPQYFTPLFRDPAEDQWYRIWSPALVR